MAQKIPVDKLVAGYKLAKPVYSKSRNNALIAAEGTILTEELIEMIKLHNVKDVLVDINADEKSNEKIGSAEEERIERLFANLEDNPIMQAIKKAAINFFKRKDNLSLK